MIQERIAVSVVEAAGMLGISRGKAYEDVNAGRIPAIRVGGRWIIPIKALTRLLESAGTGQGV